MKNRVTILQDCDSFEAAFSTRVSETAIQQPDFTHERRNQIQFAKV